MCRFKFLATGLYIDTFGSVNSAEEISCTSSRHLAADQITLELSYNGRQWYTASSTLTFIEQQDVRNTIQ
jgi:hypothetical protein